LTTLVDGIKKKKSLFSQTLNTSVERDADVGNSAQLQFRLFARLWAVAALFHMAHSSLFNAQLNFALLTLTALYVIGRPGVTSVALLAILQIFDALYRMPYTTNHWIFTAFVNLTILHALCYEVMRKRSLRVAEGTLFQTFAPVVRAEVIILYFFAVFHKLNSGFFAPLTSCAFDLLQAQNLDAILPLSTEFYKWNPYFTIAVELAIPVLLCIRRTRKAAVVIGILFHGVLAFSSYNAFYDFSSMIFAVYFLFIDPRLSESIHTAVIRSRTSMNKLFISYTVVKISVLVIGVLAGAGMLFALNQKLDSSRTVHLAFWAIYCFVALFVFICYGFRSGTTQGAPSFSIVHWSLILLPVIVFINGISPYLGLKTENSYAMFSNLRTEGGVTNHFILPASIQLFGYQKEVVEIVSSTDRGLQELADQNKAIVLFEFRNHIQNRRPERVEYLLNGQRRSYVRSDVATHAGLQPNPFVLTRLMRFRSFRKNEPQPCSH
jgi:hypothetical protein